MINFILILGGIIFVAVGVPILVNLMFGDAWWNN